MGFGLFLLGAVLGSMHVVEKRTTHEIEYRCPLTRRTCKHPPTRITKITIVPRFKSKEDIEEYFIGKPRNEETMAELKAVLEAFDKKQSKEEVNG